MGGSAIPGQADLVLLESQPDVNQA